MKVIFTFLSLLLAFNVYADDLGKCVNCAPGAHDEGVLLSQGQAVPLLGINSKEMYYYISMDKLGRIRYSCEHCPNKFCKEFACTLTIDSETHVEKGNCECEK